MNKSAEPRLTINPNRSQRRNLRAVGIALATTALLSACSSSNKEPIEAPRTVPSVTATVETKSPQQLALDKEIKSQEQANAEAKVAESYLASSERNITLKKTVQSLGKRVIDAAENQKIGYFDFYNIDTKDWGRGKGNAGWGYLQHNPQYGGSKNQVFATVFQNADGSFNREKGVQAVSVVMSDKMKKSEYVSIESPLTTQIDSGIKLPIPAWETSISLTNNIDGGSQKTHLADAYNSDVLTSQQIASLDAKVVSTLTHDMNKLGL